MSDQELASPTQGEPSYTVAVLGATGAVGQDLLRALGRSGLSIGELRLMAGPGSRGTSVEVDDKAHRVHALPAEPESSTLFEGVQIAFLCLPPDVARAQARSLADRGILVIDLSGVSAGEAPITLAGVSELPSEIPDAGRLLVAPSAPAAVLATVLGALRGLGVSGCRGTILQSAGAAGKAGVEELSQQVVALFNQGEPPRKVFPGGLAFDLIGQSGSLIEGWTSGERRIAEEVALLTGLPATEIGLTLITVPLFAGLSVSIHVRFDEEVGLDDVLAALGDSPSLRVGDPVPGPRRVVGKGAVHVGRVRLDPAGDGIHLWAVADNLRFGASASAIGLALAAIEAGWL
jgi:aspartate-semialdehyde dehydrogenase